MSIVAAIYWAGVLFALGISLPLSQSLAEDNPIAQIGFLLLFAGLALWSWVFAGILIGAVLGSILNRTEG